MKLISCPSCGGEADNGNDRLRAERDALRAFARHVLSERISLSNESAAERYGLITWRWVDGYFIRSLTPLLTGEQQT